MKKLYVLGAAMALVLVATGAHALGLSNVIKNSTVKSVVEDAGKMVVVNELNKDLNGMVGSCQCNAKTGQISGCDLGKVAGRINRDKKGLKMALNRNINVRSEVNRACYDQLYSNIKPTSYSYWHWYQSKYVKGSNVRVWVD